MNPKILVPIVLVVLTGAFALGAAWFMTRPTTPAPTETASEEVAALRKQLVAMDARVRQLERDVEGLERQLKPPRATSTPRAAVAPERTEARETPPAQTARAVGVDGVLDPEAEPEVRERVQEMVRDELAIEREERQRRRAERMKERTREDAEEFAARVGLDGATTERFTQRLVAERETMITLWREARDNDTDRDEVRTRMEEIRGETEAEMAELLTKDQLAAFKEEREEDAARYRRRGGR